MLRNYFKIAWRNLVKNKVYSAINITGLASGMAVAMLIGLWIWDEISFDTYHQQYDRIAQVLQRETINGKVGTGEHMPIPLANELRTVYAGDFERVVLSSFTHEHIVAHGDKKFTKKGNYMEPGAPDMLTLQMLKGTSSGLKEPSSVLLSESLAQALFGSQDPLDQTVKIDNRLNVKVTGVYEDLPYNTRFREVAFIAPWDLYVSSEDWVRDAQEKADWNNNSWQILVQLAPKSNADGVSAKIKNVKLKHDPESAVFKPEFFLHPMSQWHLYSEWDKTGKAGGRIEYVWLFGITGIFVLLLACINFMNLSTARSEKRSKEVGIRKAVGSRREQLIGQFLSESMLVVGLTFMVSLLFVILILPVFNQIADKKIALPWASPLFWLSGIAFSLVTGLLAGSYPALYLSSFEPVKVLKGTFRVGRYASLPRKVLVVLQFTVSVTLIIGTIIIFRQIQYVKNRPIGYDRSGLVMVPINTPELQGHYNALRNELLQTGAVTEMSTSSSPITISGTMSNGFEWEGKDPEFKESFVTIAVTHDFGKTVGWRFVEGRDFSRQLSTDSVGLVLNQSAASYMGLKNPVGKLVSWQGRSFQVLGIIEDMVMRSPFEPVSPTVFMLDYGRAGVVNLRLNPRLSARASMDRIEGVFGKFSPASPFDFKFVDQEYARKFAAEERVGKLASCFAVLAIFISCMGLFGLASFMAEQRTKEIGVRKVLGASVLNLWGGLSKEFVILVFIAFIIAAPTAYYFLSTWLQQFEYRTRMPWWIFALSGLGTMLITLLTVSYHGIKAASLDPVKSLRSE